MAREPAIEDQTYQDMLKFLQREGYELSDLRKVPQQW
jgi:lipocalin